MVRRAKIRKEDPQNNDIFNEYLECLTALVCYEEEQFEYSFLLSFLAKHEFYWTVDLDENRAKDGIMLRENILVECMNLPPDAISGPCSVLEMMVGLCERIAYQMEDFVEDNSLRRWFWEILDNLGLSEMSNRNFSRGQNEVYLEKNVTLLLGRGYSRNGFGGMFPLRSSKRDQRKVQILYQFYAYCDENYPLSDIRLF